MNTLTRFLLFAFLSFYILFLPPTLLAAATNTAVATQSTELTTTATQPISIAHKALATLLIVFIVGGFFFEMQTPGVGVSFVVAIVAAILFFTIFYFKDTVEQIDIILFAIGLLLILLEIFVIPGFGLAGILGLICTIAGLALALIDNTTLHTLNADSLHSLLIALALVVIGLTIGIFGSMLLSHYLTTSKRTPAMALHKEMKTTDGYIGVVQLPETLIGATGEAETILRPAGKVAINNTIYDAISTGELIAKGVRIVVIKIENNQLYVAPI